MASYSGRWRHDAIGRDASVPGRVGWDASCWRRVVTFAACSSDGEPATDRGRLPRRSWNRCAPSTATQLDALPDPPDGISVTDFATQASTLLTRRGRSRSATLDVARRPRRRSPGADPQRRGAGGRVERPRRCAGEPAGRRIARRADHDDRSNSTSGATTSSPRWARQACVRAPGMTAADQGRCAEAPVERFADH